MTKQECVNHILTRREAEQLTGLSASAFQHHLKQGNIIPCKDVGKGTGRLMLFWKDDLEKIK